MMFIKNSKFEIFFISIISISCLLCTALWSSNNIKELNENQSFYIAIKNATKEEKKILQNCFKYIENNNFLYKDIIDYTTYRITVPIRVDHDAVQYADDTQRFNSGDILVNIGNTLSPNNSKRDYAYALLILDKDKKHVKCHYPLK